MQFAGGPSRAEGRSMTRPALVWCTVLATVLTALTTFTLAWAAVLRCSGDTDGGDPSWVNGFLFGFALVAGGALAVPSRSACAAWPPRAR